MTRGLMVAWILGTACNGGKDDDDAVDTDPPVEDTYDTAAVVDDTDEDTPDPVRDSGLAVQFSLEGRAQLVGAPAPTALIGLEGFTFRWVLKDDAGLSKSRCARVWDMKDWEHDEDRLGVANPVSPENLVKCDECVFTFTMSTTNYRTLEHLPWEEPTPDAADTDPADTDPADTDPGDPKLGCNDVEEAGIFEQLALLERDWVGYGYSPDYLSDDDNPNTGTIFVWDSFNRLWVEYILGAEIVDNELRWSLELQTAEYPFEY